MLELGEDEGGADYLGDSSGAGGDALEGGPALGEQGEPAFSLAAEAAEQAFRVLVRGRVAGFRRVLDGDVDADSGALVAAVGEGRHSGGGGAVEGGQGVAAGGGDVVDVAGLGRAGPERGGRRGA